MSHELDHNQATGEASMIYVGETPWHRLGIRYETAPGLDEALVKAGLSFTVEKVPHFFRVPVGERPADPAGDGYVSGGLDVGTGKYVAYRQSHDGFSIIRTDRMQAIGTVGTSYQPLQNATAFGVLRPLLDDGIAVIETAGAIREGRQVWMLVRFDLQTVVRKAIEAGANPAITEVLAGEVLPYGLFTNDHSGKAKARIKETAIRVVCANTFGMAMDRNEDGTSVEVGHTGDVAVRYRDAAQKLLSGIAIRYGQLANARLLMKQAIIGTRMGEVAGMPYTRLVLDTVAPVHHLERKIQRHEGTGHTKAALEKAHTLREEIRDLWFTGKGHDGDGSAWEAYQGAVEWIDHAETSLRGQDERDERRVQSLYDGQLGRTKGRVGRDLLAYVAGTEEQRAALVS